MQLTPAPAARTIVPSWDSFQTVNGNGQPNTIPSRCASTEREARANLRRAHVLLTRDDFGSTVATLAGHEPRTRQRRCARHGCLANEPRPEGRKCGRGHSERERVAGPRQTA